MLSSETNGPRRIGCAKVYYRRGKTGENSERYTCIHDRGMKALLKFSPAAKTFATLYINNALELPDGEFRKM